MFKQVLCGECKPIEILSASLSKYSAPPMTFNICFSPNRPKVDTQCLIQNILI